MGEVKAEDLAKQLESLQHAFVADGYTGKAPRLCGEAASLLRSQAEEIARLREAVEEAIRQIEYLHGKFAETGSGNAVLARLRAAINRSGEP
jgi:hypothetical protein